MNINLEILKTLSKTRNVSVWLKPEYNILSIEGRLVSHTAEVDSLFRLKHQNSPIDVGKHSTGSYYIKENNLVTKGQLSSSYIATLTFIPNCPLEDDEVLLSGEHMDSFFKVRRNSTQLDKLNFKVIFGYVDPSGLVIGCEANFIFHKEFWLITTSIDGELDVCYMNTTYDNEVPYWFIGEDKYNKIFNEDEI